LCRHNLIKPLKIEKTDLPPISHFLTNNLPFTVSFLRETKKYMYYRFNPDMSMRETLSEVISSSYCSKSVGMLWNTDELHLFFKRMKKKLEDEGTEMLKRLEIYCGDGWVEKEKHEFEK
jgi:hypothetical protein